MIRTVFAIVVLAVVGLCLFGFVEPVTGSGHTSGIGIGTGSSGGSTSSGSAGTLILEDIIERKSATSYKLDSGGTSYSTLTNRHTIGLQYRYHVESVPDTSSVRNYISGQSIHVGTDTELGPWSGHTPGTGTVTTSSGTDPSLSFSGLGSDNFILVQKSSTGAITGATLVFYIVTTASWEDWNSGTMSWVPHSSYSWIKCTVDLDKFACDDASVDSRKTFGQPNIEGVITPDANDPLGPVKFGNWVFKGGVFAGHVPSSSGDRSGTARIQLWPQLGSATFTNAVAASLVLFDMGRPSSFTNDTTLGVFIPGSGDTHLTVVEGDVNWDNKWDITPHAVTSGQTNWSLYPFSAQTSGSSTAEDYLSWRLFAIGGGSIPDRALEYLCLAATDETATAWRYFGSKEYQTGSTFPRNDCAPRVWVADEVSVVDYP